VSLKGCVQQRGSGAARYGGSNRVRSSAVQHSESLQNKVFAVARRPEGIFAAPFETGEIGPDLFRNACKFGLEGLVSKRRDRPYCGGPSKYWVKVKNPAHPAYRRVQDQF
jgi:hypothetical protein